MKKLLLFVMFIVYSSAIFAQSADDVTGIWWNDIKSSKIKVEKKEGKYIGTIVYIIPEKYVTGLREKTKKILM